MIQSNFFKIILFGIVLSLLTSCSNQDLESSTPYYKFTQEDKKLILPDQKIGTRYYFKSKLNNEIIYEIVKEETLKRDYRVGAATLFGSFARFHYDERTISWRPNSGCNCNNYDIEYTFQRLPIEYTEATKSNSPIPFPSRMDLYMDFVQWTGSGSYNIYIDVKKSRKYSFSNYGKSYENVIIIETDRDKTKPIVNPNVLLVDIIYYDVYTGVVGYTTTEREEYWLYKVE